MRRSLTMFVVVVVVVASVAMAAAPAQAKVPTFEVEVLEEPGRGGGDLRVLLTLDATSNGFDAPDLDGLLAALPADVLDDDLRPRSAINPLEGAVEIPLRRAGDGIYEGSVRLPDLGQTWVIVPFPASYRSSAALTEAGYPGSIPLEGERGLGTMAIGVMAVLGLSSVGVACRSLTRRRDGAAAQMT